MAVLCSAASGNPHCLPITSRSTQVDVTRTDTQPVLFSASCCCRISNSSNCMKLKKWLLKPIWLLFTEWSINVQT